MALGAQAADGVVRVGADRAAAVGHDLALGWQLRQPVLELLEWDRARPLDVAGLELLGQVTAQPSSSAGGGY